MGKDRVRSALRAHWALLAASMLLLGLILVGHGLTSGQFGEDHSSPAGAKPAAAALLNGGPVVNTNNLDIPGRTVGAHTIALTFDDGPSQYTGQILDVLERFHVHGTFFMVGKQVAENPGLVRRVMQTGNELGLHTFTHPELGAVSAWRENVELEQTQHAIAAATGYTTNLLRLPFSSRIANLSPEELLALQRAANYWAVFTDLDTKDWARPGTAQIVASARPVNGAGAIVMMHDGGGDRSETVAALAILILQMQKRGYHFGTVSQAAGLISPFLPAATIDRMRGSVMVAAIRLGDLMAWLMSATMIMVAVLSVLRLIFLVLFARRHTRTVGALANEYLPSVTVIIPAFNEEVGIVAAIRSIADSDYPFFEIIVVDDGSTDGTVGAVTAADVSGVRLIHQDNAGKPAALNTGINQSTNPILVLMDGDTIFEPQTLRRLVRQLADPAVGAVSGNTKVGNRKGILGKWQHIEYVIGFNLDRRMFDVLHCMPTIPGAIGAFRRTTLEQVGGVSSQTLAEDTDLTMAVCRAGWRVVYEPEAVAWTEVPASLGQLWRQRYRWCFGTMQAMWKHRRAVIERGASGKLGHRGLPYLALFQVLLPLLAPVVDIAAIYSIVFDGSLTIALTWLAFLLLQLLAARYAFFLDRESPRPLWVLVTQQFLYRQLMYLVVIQSVISAIGGIHIGWQKLRRIGSMDAAPLDQDGRPKAGSANGRPS